MPGRPGTIRVLRSTRTAPAPEPGPRLRREQRQLETVLGAMLFGASGNAKAWRPPNLSRSADGRDVDELLHAPVEQP